LCCRLLALYLLMNSVLLLSRSVSSLNSIGSVVLSSTSSSTSSGINSFNFDVTYNGARATGWQMIPIIAFTLLPTNLSWLAAIGFWVGAREIAIRIFEDVTEEIEAGPAFVVGTQVRAVAFACMGLFFLAQDAPQMLVWLASVLCSWFFWSHPNLFAGYTNFAWEWLIRMPLSLWLIFGLRGLAGLWKMAQQKGIAPTH